MFLYLLLWAIWNKPRLLLTMLRILEQKGYIRHEKEGRAFVYEPLVARNEAQQSAVRDLVSRFFNNSPELLALHILENDELDPAEIKRLKEMIAASDMEG